MAVEVWINKKEDDDPGVMDYWDVEVRLDQGTGATALFECQSADDAVALKNAIEKYAMEAWEN